MYPDETEEWEKEDAELEEYALKTGGGGSNMAEPLYFEPGPPGIPADLPPEEIADRKKRTAQMEETLKSYFSKIENSSHPMSKTNR